MSVTRFVTIAFLITALLIVPAAAWSPPTDRSVVGVEWNASDPSPALRWIDVDGNTLVQPDFDNHVIWGNVRKVLLDDDEVVTRAITPRGDTLDLTGVSGKVMTEIPKFYVMSTNASTDQFRYYRWYISPDPTDGFELHPAFVQRGGTERDYIYLGSYEATLRVLDDGTLALDSRSGEQPWTGYNDNVRDGMFALGFVGGSQLPIVGATITGGTSGSAGQLVDLYVSSGSWGNNNAAGTLYLKQTTGSYTNGEDLKVSGSTVATAATATANAGVVANISTFEAAGEALGDGYGAMNIWSFSAVHLLHLIEYANWGSQETVGLGIVSKGSGTGFAGEVTGFNSVDTNVDEYGTGTGTGTAGYTPASYRSMTDLWGNSWEWITGYTSTNTEYRITKRDGTGSLSTHPLAAGSYESSVATPRTYNAETTPDGYWTSLEYEDLLQYHFIPNEVGGTYLTYGTDYLYCHRSGTRALRAGGGWNGGRIAGLGDLYAYHAASQSHRNCGARLEFVGPTTMVGGAPGAQYALNATSGNAPLAVALSDESTGNPGWWRWDFGDDTTSTDQNPTHVYTAPGTYTVTLTSYTLYGEDTVTKIIEVLDPPVANMTYNATEGNAPLTVQFNDASVGNITGRLWDFSDDQTSTEQHPVHTYTTAGTYTVTLTVNNAHSTSNTTTTITVLEPPVAGFSANTTAGNAPLTVQFNDASVGNITGRLWDFGDDQTSTEQHPVHTYTTAGTYTVTLNASNPYSSNLETKTGYVTVYTAPSAGFSANITAGNTPLTIQFTDTSQGDVTAWNWNFGDGNTSTDRNPIHTYTVPGNHTVTLNVSNAYGYDTEIKTGHITAHSPPVASFSASPTTLPVEGSVQFTDVSTGDITNYHWSFGDSNTSTAQNPAHIYTAPGLYTVTLNVSNAYGYALETKAAYIDVGLPPAPAFSADYTGGNAPLTVQFTDLSTNTPTSWLWDFGDGNTSTDQNPSHLYTVPGNHTVTLTTTNAYGENTETKVSYITALSPAVAGFSANTTVGNAPLTVQFSDESTGDVTGWSWDFGDTHTSTTQNPVHTYTAPGNYTVAQTVNNPYNQDTETRISYITVLSPPVASFSASPTIIPVGGSVLFTDASTGDITNYHWSFGDTTTSALQSPSHTYTSPGLYTVTLNVSNAYGYALETKAAYIDVGYPPVADFSPSVTIGVVPVGITFTDQSTNTPTTWHWDFGDGNTSTEQSPTHTYSTSGNYSITLNVSNAYGNSTETKPDLIALYDPVSASFTADTPIGLTPLAVQFTDTSTGAPTLWSWDFGDGNTSTEQHPEHTYVTEGSYTVTLTAANGGSNDTQTQTDYIMMFDPVTASFTANKTLGLAPLTIQFTDTSTGTPSTWLWDFGDGNTSMEQNPVYQYVAPGSYTITLTVAAGYIGENPPLTSDIVTSPGPVLVYAPLVPAFQAAPTTGYIPLAVQFTDTSTGSPTAWLWDFGDSTSSTDQNPTHTYTTRGTYTVTLTISHPADEQSTTKTNYIIADQPLTPSFVVNNSYGMVPLAVQFTDTTAGDPIGHLWDFGDGHTSTEQHPVHTYTVPGHYNVSLTVYSLDSEFTVVRDNVVHVGILPAVSFTGSPTTGTTPLTVTFTGTYQNTESYLWDFGDGQTSTERNPTHTYNTPGTYSVAVTATNSYGNAVSSKPNYITVTHLAPVAAFTGSPLSGRAPVPVTFTDLSTNTPTSWLWDFGDGTTSTERNPRHIYRDTGTYTVTLTASNSGGSDTEIKIGYVTTYSSGDPGYTDRYPKNRYLTTMAATDLGTQAATLNAELTATGATDVWFEYGTRSNSYGYKTDAITAEPGSLIRIPIKKFPLIAGQTYYYRAASADGYGAEMCFTLPAVTPRPTTTYGAAANRILNSFEDGDTIVQDMVEATWSPYIASLGSLFFAFVIGAIFLNLAMKGHSIAIPTLLVMIIGASLWAFVPPEFVIIAQAFLIMGIAGLVYYIYAKRKL